MNYQMSWALRRDMATSDFGDGPLDYRLTSGALNVENVLMTSRRRIIMNRINNP